MTLDDFIKKYQGKFVEYHSYNANALYQCADLANQYITEVLGFPAIIGTNAQDFPSKRGNNFDWIVNTPEGLPEKGDLIIFKSSDGIGHISIFIDGNLSLFRSFDQNYPTGSPCQIVQHNYRNVLGWLRPRKATMATMYKGLDLTNQDSMKVAVDIWDEAIIKKLWVKLSELKELFDVTDRKTIVQAIAEVKNRYEQISRLKDQLTTETNLRIELASSLSGCESAVRVYENDIVSRNTKINEQAKHIGELMTEIAILKDALSKPESDVIEEKPESISKNSTLEQVIAWIKNLFFSSRN